MFEDKPDVLSVTDVAELLSIGRGLVYKSIRTGELRSRKVGRKNLITKTSLIEFLNTFTNSPQQQTKSTVGKVE